jgi:hypothetical protein
VQIQWLRSIAEKVGLIGAALLTVSALTSCGGGGVAALPGTTTTTTTALLVLPTTADMFPDTPVTFTVSGGTPPYAAFSGNTTVIPISNSQVSGNTFTLTANDVVADTPVTITVRDFVNATVTSTASVHQAVLANQFVFTPIAQTATGCGTAICSGGDAQLTVTAIQNGIKVPNRPITFTVFQGAFQFVEPNSVSLVNSITVTTDATGFAVVKLRVQPTVPTQVATLTATDTVTGQVRFFNFNIVQQTSGAGILSVLPSGSVTTKGATGPTAPAGQVAIKGSCPAGAIADYYIFGGTPPYTVVSPLVDVATVSPSVVTTNGGTFRATASPACPGTVSFIVTDATARTIETSSFITVQGDDGAVAPAPAAPPTTTIPVLSPSAVTLPACAVSGTVSLSGTGSYAGTVVTPNGSPGISFSPSSGALPTTVTVTRSPNPLPAPATPGTVLVNFTNSAGTAVLTVTNSAGANCP